MVMTEDLIASLNQQIDKYKIGVNAGWHLTAPDIEDAMNTAYVRDEIHTILSTLMHDNTFVDASELKKVDEKWQSQLLSYIANSEVEVPYYPNNDEPSSKWWFHIEELDKLSDEERSTL